MKIQGPFQCVVRGPYGPGNLGDDLLLVVTYRIARTVYARNEVAVTAYDIGRMRRFIGGSPVVHFSEFYFSDVTILGGGGQYFSFSDRPKQDPSGTVRQRIRGILSSGLGICRVIRTGIYKVLLRRRWLSDLNIALSIGIGPFRSDSGRLAAIARRELPTFDLIISRDSDSFSEAFKLGCRNVLQTSDLIFSTLAATVIGCLSPKYFDNKSPAVPLKPAYRVGLVFRYWPYSSTQDQFDYLIQLITRTLAVNPQIEIALISFYEEYDLPIIKLLRSAGYQVDAWQPDREEKIGLQIQQLLARLDFVITMRAHGAIVSALLGIPSILIEVERKLRKVHQMLETSSIIVPYSAAFLGNEWALTLARFTANLHQYRSNVTNDVASARRLADQGVEKVAAMLQDRTAC